MEIVITRFAATLTKGTFLGFAFINGLQFVSFFGQIIESDSEFDLRFPLALEDSNPFIFELASEIGGFEAISAKIPIQSPFLLGLVFHKAEFFRTDPAGFLTKSR